jgi:hypothetical protein
MESLGGDEAWFDRFVAQHSAIVYYWFLILFYALSPKYAYAFSELVEGHATDTYDGVSSEEPASNAVGPAINSKLRVIITGHLFGCTVSHCH